MQHLGCHDYRFSSPLRCGNDSLLLYGQRLQIGLNRQVATINHNDISRSNNLVNMLNAALVLNLADDPRPAIVSQCTNCLNMGGRLDKTDSYEVNTIVPGESYHFLVARRHQRGAKADIGHVYTLAATQNSCRFGNADDISPHHRLNHKTQSAVISRIWFPDFTS